MFQKQKEALLPLLRKQEAERNYYHNYLIAYHEFLDTEDNFTNFCCECAEGKEPYSVMIGEIINRDKTAKIFVQVYGFEEEKDGSNIFIYADTLIIFTMLSDEQIQEVIDMSDDIFPSDFGKIDDDLSNYSVIDGEGKISPLLLSYEEKQRVLYLWWD